MKKLTILMALLAYAGLDASAASNREPAAKSKTTRKKKTASKKRSSKKIPSKVLSVAENPQAFQRAPTKPARRRVWKQLLPPLSSAESYGRSNAPIIYETGTNAERQTLLWFHGSMQDPDNDLTRRLVNGFQQAGLSLEVHAVPLEYGYENSPYIKELMAKGKVFIGGHSAGGGAVARLASQYADRVIGMIPVNGGVASGAKVPGLTIVGENDFGGASFLRSMKKKERRAAKKQLDRSGVLVINLSDSDNPDRVVIASKGDHSIRFREGDTLKEVASLSEETSAMNLAVATVVKDYVDRQVAATKIEQTAAKEVAANAIAEKTASKGAANKVKAKRRTAKDTDETDKDLSFQAYMRDFE